MPDQAILALVTKLGSADRQPSTFASYLQAGAVVALAYYVGCLAGFALRFPSSGIAYIWPPNAILLASLLLLPRSSWPMILGGALVAHGFAHTQDGLPILTWLYQYLGNGLQAVLAATIILRCSDLPLRFNTLRGVTAFIVGAAVVAPMIASIVPAFKYVSMGWSNSYGTAWGARTLTNLVTTVTLVPPLVLIFTDARRLLTGSVMVRAAEFLLLVAGLFAVDLVAVAVQRSGQLGFVPALYAPMPFLAWAAVRFGCGGVSLCLLFVAAMFIRAALGGESALAGSTPTQTVLAVQMFVGIWAVPLMVLSALLREHRDARRTLEATLDQRQRTEDALHQSEARTRAILHALPDLMFLQTKDADHRYLDYYARNQGDLLVSPDRFLGKPMRDVLPPDLATSFHELIATTVEADRPGILEYSLPINNETRIYEARIVTCDDDKVLSIVRDITDRKRVAEALRVTGERYALAAAAGGVGVWDWNLETNEIYVDPALKRLLGFEDSEIANHLDAWGRRVHPDDADLVMARAQEHLDGKSPTFEVEHRMLHKDGTIRWFLARGARVTSAPGQPLRIMGTDTDITDRKQAEEALHRAQQELTYLSRASALGELAASIAHEVHQPLSAIAANAAACLNWMARGTGHSNELREALADIVEDTNRASTVIRRTRDLFTHAPHEKAPVELNSTIMEVLALTRTRAERAAVSIRTDLQEGGVLILGDRVQLQQVLLNLIGNGLDAMRHTTRANRVLQVQSRCNDGVADVAVRDAGHGFNPEDIDRIFDPFFTTKSDGLGIGLAISRSIIHAHGGRLVAALNDDAGATFQFSIPLAGGTHE